MLDLSKPIVGDDIASLSVVVPLAIYKASVLPLISTTAVETLVNAICYIVGFVSGKSDVLGQSLRACLYVNVAA